MSDEGQVPVVSTSPDHGAQEWNAASTPAVPVVGQRVVGTAVRGIRQGPEPTPEQADPRSGERGVSATYEATAHMAKSRANRRRRERLRSGESAWGDMDAVQAHIRKLRGQGMGVRQIAALADISDDTLGRLVWNVRRGKTRRIHIGTAERILAVRLDPRKLPARSPVDSTHARRLLQALVVAGWTVPLLAERYGTDRQNFLKYFYKERFAAGVCVRIFDMFEELWREGPPQVSSFSATKARRLAERHGWVGIGAWDEGTIDDPDAKPNLLGDPESTVDAELVRRAFDGRERFASLNSAERVELARRWSEAGHSRNLFERRFAVSGATATRYFKLAISDDERKSA